MMNLRGMMNLCSTLLFICAMAAVVFSLLSLFLILDIVISTRLPTQMEVECAIASILSSFLLGAVCFCLRCLMNLPEQGGFKPDRQ